MDRRYCTIKKLRVPYCPDSSKERIYYEVNSIDEKLVCDYTKMNFAEIDELNYFVFLIYKRDAIIYNNSLTKEGRSHLEECYMLEQKKTDRTTLRTLFKKDSN